MTRQAKARAVTEALKKIAKNLPGQSFNELRVVIALERAVARLENHPKLKAHLIFKGGFVLLKTIETHRFTRDVGRIERVAADVKVRSPQSEIRILQAEFLDPAAIQDTVDGIVAQGKVDIVLIAHGSLPEQADCQNDLQACREALEINGVSPVLYAEAFVKHMAKADHGTIALIGSVAGDRGRKSNYVYGAAKGLVTRYTQGLQHRFTGTGVRVVLIKPGPTDTPMTAHLKDQGAKLASVSDVARIIVSAIDSSKAVASIYAPSKWKLIMLVIQHLPASIFNRINI